MRLELTGAELLKGKTLRGMLRQIDRWEQRTGDHQHAERGREAVRREAEKRGKR
jgi:hypothetical protein